MSTIKFVIYPFLNISTYAVIFQYCWIINLMLNYKIGEIKTTKMQREGGANLIGGRQERQGCIFIVHSIRDKKIE